MTVSDIVERLHQEISALRRLAASVPDDAIAQASIAGQINALEWLAAGRHAKKAPPGRDGPSGA